MPTIAISQFVRRQTTNSPYAHFKRSWEELRHLVEEYFGAAQPGYRDGVVLVPVPPEGFWASTVEVDATTKLKATFGARQNGEDPFIQVVAEGAKQPAVAVDIVLYRADVLAEDNDRSSDADWEVININARLTEEPEPMDPMTMARNMAHLPGGTEGKFTAWQFVESILYWSKRCRVG
jgi:hypothetical protein